MRIAVAGGTGTAGRPAVSALHRGGHDVVVLARSRGVDLSTGRGVADALEGVRTVVDASNIRTASGRRASRYFTAATRHLLQACASVGVRHIVVLSVVGIDRIDLGYYQAKRRQEHLLVASGVPVTVVRATQFHELVPQIFTPQRSPIIMVPRWRTQPVSALEVGEWLAELAVAEPSGEHVMAGPRVAWMADLVRKLVIARGRSQRVIEVAIPGKAGRTLAMGGSVPDHADRLGTQTFEQWLAGGEDCRADDQRVTGA